MNKETRSLRDSIIALVNASPIPIEVKRLVFYEVYRKLSDVADEIVQKEAQIQSEQEQVTFATLQREIEERDKEGSENGNAESV